MLSGREPQVEGAQLGAVTPNSAQEAARCRLEASSLSADEIANACGLASAEVLRRMFQRCLHVTPGQYRAAFGKVDGPDLAEIVALLSAHAVHRFASPDICSARGKPK